MSYFSFRRTIFLYPFFFCLFNTVKTFSQHNLGVPSIINYSKFDFKGGAQTWQIAQDKRGIMYFANNEGLLTFDGNYWRIYPLPNNTIVRSLGIDNNGRIYVGGQGEIGYFSPTTSGKLTYTSLKSKIPEQFKKFADIWQISIIEDVVFFRASDRMFEYNNDVIQVYASNFQWNFLKVANKTTYALDDSTGLLKFQNKKWVPLKNGKMLARVLIAEMFPIKDNSILVTTKADGFFLIQKDSIIKVNNSLSNIYINAAIKIGDSSFAIATSTQGILILDSKYNKTQQFSSEDGLQNNNIVSIFIDKGKNIWTGLNNGISLISYGSSITYINPDQNATLANYSSLVFNDKLYLATSNGVYASPSINYTEDISSSKGKFTLVKTSNDGEAWHLDEVNNHLLLAHNSGCYRIENDEASLISSRTGSWLFLPTSSIYPAHDILVGTYNGIKLIEYEKNSFIDKGMLEGLQDSYRFMVADNNGDIWASHPYRGIYKLTLSADKKKYTSQLFTTENGLPSNINNYVFKLKNRIVFATVQGIYEYNASLNKFLPAKQFSSIFGNIEIRYLVEDDDKNIWFCSGKKLGVISPVADSINDIPRIRYFPELTGKILSGFENIYPYNRKNIFIGSESGVIHLNYEKYCASHTKISAFIGTVKGIGKTDSTIFGGYFPSDEKGNFFQERNQIPKLPSNYNSFHFEYSSLAYSMQKSIEYSYQLEGYDSDWSAWSSKTEKDYTNLPSGSYTFKVKVRDNLYNESEPVTYSFIIAHPWYKTILGQLLFCILFLFLLFLIRKWHDKKLESQRQKFQEEQNRIKYIHQLELEKNEKEIIKLQNEKLEQEVLLKKKELANASMHLVENADTLAKIKEEISRINNNSAPENNDIKRIAGLLKETEKSNANWEMFAIHFDELNDDFLKKIKKSYPELSNSDLKVCAYLKLNLSTKEIAQLLNISIRGVEVSRYRIRKKLGLQTEQPLNTFLNSI